MRIERGRKASAGQSRCLDGGVVGLLGKWSEVDPIDVLCGGFMCQDISTVGKQGGLAPITRSGLWSFMAEAIETLQSRWAVIENGARPAVGSCNPSRDARSNIEGDPDPATSAGTDAAGVERAVEVSDAFS